MIIKTKFFGEVEIEDNLLLKFKEGIPGFDSYKEYAIIDVEDKKFKCLQSLDKEELCLILVSPWDYFEDYEIDLDDIDVKRLGIETQNDVLVLNIVTVRENIISANLLAPIIVNIKNRESAQIVMNTNKYSIREKIECLY
ncbi:MAG: flagellar assembly protein FliW [Clostridium sp.]|uniref:flagellar assembly protein FliW n=1 Tax=Clostridium sp. TaxID=1506 RepID=UPI002FC7129D